MNYRIFFVLCVLFLILKCSQLVHCNYRLHFVHKKRFGSLIYINSKNVPISQSLWLVESVLYIKCYILWGSLKLFNLLHKTIWCLKQLNFLITYIRIYESMFEFVFFCLSLMFFFWGGVTLICFFPYLHSEEHLLIKLCWYKNILLVHSKHFYINCWYFTDVYKWTVVPNIF